MSEALVDRQPDSPDPLGAQPPDAGDAGHPPVPEQRTPVPAAAGARRESVVCPECGTTAAVALARRDAADFCARCDYPLFWTPATIQLGDGATAEEALRRLPGTAGRVTVASTPCPHCNEANTLAATTCVRCGLPMVVEEPPPAPVVVAPPPPPPEPEPGTPWWLWALLALTGVAFVALMAWFLLDP